MNIGIVFAGGSGKRMKNKGLPKQFLKIYNIPIIIHTLNVFQKCEKIDAIVIACIKDYINYMNELINEYSIDKVKSVVEGGETCQLSIYNALKEAKKLSGDSKDIVLIHDGVRPLIDEKLLERNIESVIKFGSAVSCVSQKETTIISRDKEQINSITDRDNTFVARAPQSFYLEEILEADERALPDGENNIIDSCSLMMKYGKKLHIVECNSDNIKITTPDDYYIAKALIEAKENLQIFGA